MKTHGRLRLLWAGTALVLALAVVALACTGGGSEDNLASPGADSVVITVTTPTPVATATATPTTTPTATPTATPLAVCTPNPDPAPPSILQVQEPRPEERVKSPLHVRGWGAGIRFEDKGVQVALVNANGDPLVVVSAPPQTREGRIPPAGLEVNVEFTAPFGADLSLDVTQPTLICIWVFEESAQTGNPIHVVQVPVLVVPPNDPSPP